MTDVLHVQLSELACPALTVLETDAIRMVAARMAEKGQRAALVVGTDDSLQGIVTDMDLRSRVLAVGLDSQLPVSTVMTPDPLVIPTSLTASEALLLAARHKIRHVPVVLPAGGFGIVSAFDLLRQYDYNAAWLVGDIHVASDVKSLSVLSQRLPAMLVRMVRNTVPARDITHSLSLVGQEIVHRLLKLGEMRFGSPPIPYAFIVAGSMGRHEQSIHTDQDNAMILDDRFVPELHDAYFQQLARFVSDGLAACGYVYCPGNIMATNPQWRQPLRVWQAYFRQWIETPEPQALLNATIFFDLRCAYGEEALWRELRDSMLARTQVSNLFQTLMAGNARAFQPALGFWGGLVTERNEAGEKHIDMKKRGVTPVVDLARVYALAHGVAAANTFERLEALAQARVLNQDDIRELQEALGFISGLRLRQQAQQIQKGVAADNAVRIWRLSSLERGHLRDAFQVVAGLQRAMFRDFQAT